MRKHLVIAAVVGFPVFGIVAGASPAAAARLPGSHTGGAPLTATLSGTGNQSGTATLTVNPGQQEVCYDITVANLQGGVILAHIHVGDVGVNGPVVVPLFSFTPATTQTHFSGCMPGSRATLRAILQNPSHYYVNVHTTVFRAGAVRGQLSHGE
jgi:CHRD domain